MIKIKQPLARTTFPRSMVWVVFGIAVILLTIGVLFVLAGPSLSKPLIMDEMEFPSVARAIMETGKPIYYRGELLPANVGLWHPPLYILTYALWVVGFGVSVESFRTFGLFNAALALGLVGWFTLRRWRLFDRSASAQWLSYLALLIGLLVAATSPLYIQGSILPDIDTQVLPLTLTAMFLVLFELRRHTISNRVYWSVFIVAMVIQLFAKLTTPILIIPTMMVYELARGSGAFRLRVRGMGTPESRRPLRMLLTIERSIISALLQAAMVLLAFLVSLAIFMGLWYVIARVWGVDFNIPFMYLTQSTNNPANFGANPLAIILAGIPEHAVMIIQWLSWPAIILVLLLIAREWFNPLDGLLGRPERFAIYTFVLLLAAMYLILRPAPFMFPKYYPPLVIPLALLAIDLLFATLRQERARYAIGLLVGIVIVYQIYAWVRPGMRAQDFIYNYYWIAAKDPLITWWMAVPLTFSLIGGVLVAWRARLRFMNLLAVASLAAMLGWQIQEVVLQAYVPYATTYYYGEHSLVEVTKFLHENLPAGTLIVAPKDVGYRVQDRMRYIELSAEPLQDLSRPDVHYLVTRTNDYYGNSIFYAPEVAAMVEKNYTNIATIQNFVVLQHVAAK